MIGSADIVSSVNIYSVLELVLRFLELADFSGSLSDMVFVDVMSTKCGFEFDYPRPWCFWCCPSGLLPTPIECFEPDMTTF